MIFFSLIQGMIEVKPIYKYYSSCFFHNKKLRFVTDKHMGKIVGELNRGKPDIRFDEGAEGMRPTGNLPLATVNTHLFLSLH